MKKSEAEILAPQKVDFIINCITKILDEQPNNISKIEFNTIKIDGQSMCVLDIYSPVNEEDMHFNLGITSEHINVLFKEFLDRIIATIFSSENIGATKFYRLRSNLDLFDGVSFINQTGGEVKVNMYGCDKKIYDEYNENYDVYKNSLRKR